MPGDSGIVSLSLPRSRITLSHVDKRGLSERGEVCSECECCLDFFFFGLGKERENARLIIVKALYGARLDLVFVRGTKGSVLLERLVGFFRPEWKV